MPRAAVAGLGGGFQFCRLSARSPCLMPVATSAGCALRSWPNLWLLETGQGYTGCRYPCWAYFGGAGDLFVSTILKDTSVGGGNAEQRCAQGATRLRWPCEALLALVAVRAAALGIVFKQTLYALE